MSKRQQDGKRGMRERDTMKRCLRGKEQVMKGLGGGGGSEENNL